MKIAFLSRYQDSIRRGAETFVREVGRELRKRHEVIVLSGDKADAFLGKDYQIVVAINGGLQVLKASLGRFKNKYKLVITGQAGVGRGEIFNLVLAKPDLYVALTESMYEWAKRWAWGTKLVKIPNGIDLNKFSPKGQRIDLELKKPIILSVGALVWYKHHDRLIRAVREIGKGSVLIVGEGEEKEDLEKLGKELLGDRFKITNFKYEDMPKVYRSCDLFTLPSWSREAFGIVYLEALASGLGVVAPDDPSRGEIIGDAGILVDVLDAEKYADAIEKALGTDWSKKVRAQAEKFSWDKIAKEYEQTFRNLL